MSNILKGKSLWVATFVMLILGMVWALPANSAENSRLIPFQGRLTDTEGAALNGVYRITFAIYDAPTGGVDSWTEFHESVSVINGQLNVLLGSMTNLDDPDGNGDPSDAVLFDASSGPRFLGIKVGEDTNQEMIPRQQLVPAFHARTADQATEANNADTLDGHDSSYFASSLVPSGLISMWSGSVQNIPSAWALCDGTKGTPDLRDKFIVGAGNSYSVNNTGGTLAQTVSGNTSLNGDHSHGHNLGTTVSGSHTHTYSGTTGTEFNDGRWFDSGDRDRRYLENHRHNYNGTTSSAGTHLHGITGTISNAGSHQHSFNASFDNRPPYYALAFIMKL